jgi:hypothetical protein
MKNFRNEETDQSVSETFKLRYYYPDELVKLLQLNGFNIINSYEGFDMKKKLPDTTTDFTVVCKKE